MIGPREKYDMQARGGNGQDNIATFAEFESMILIPDARFFQTDIVIMPRGDNLGGRHG
jgi:hypothetical protein